MLVVQTIVVFQAALDALKSWTIRLRAGIYGLGIASATLVLNEITSTLHQLALRGIPQLPLEVIGLIIQELHNLPRDNDEETTMADDLDSLSIVHSSWTPIAQRLLLSSLATWDTSISILIEQLNNGLGWAKHVKKLHIQRSSHVSSSESCDASSLEQALRLLPGLTTLKVRDVLLDGVKLDLHKGELSFKRL